LRARISKLFILQIDERECMSKVNLLVIIWSGTLLTSAVILRELHTSQANWKA